MADFSQLIADVQAVIRENGRQLITGPVLQSTLIEIINTINADKQDPLNIVDALIVGSMDPVTSNAVEEAVSGLYAALEEKQDTIADLDAIRAGALLGSTAYQKPAGGIPVSDMNSTAQAAIENASSKGEYAGQLVQFDEEGFLEGSGITPEDVYQLPESGIPYADLEEEVQMDLIRARDAVLTSDVKNELGYGAETPIAQDIVTETFSQQRELIDGKADAEGLAKDLTAGAVLGAPRAAEFLHRVAPADGPALIQTFKGKTLAWNQLCRINVVSETSFTNGVKVNADGVKVVIEIATGGATAQRDINNVVNYDRKVVSGTYRLYDGLPQNAIDAGIIIINAYTGNVNEILAPSRSATTYNLRVPSGAPAGTYVVYPQIYDLTYMFGSGNEPSTVAEFRALYPAAYYPYNAGTLINNAATSIKTTGRNQWDEVWETRGSGSTLRLCSKNRIPVFPSTQYYFQGPSAPAYGMRFFAADGTTQVGSTVYSGGSFTTPAGAYYMDFQMSSDYGATYKNDICINISDPAFNGQYAPYEERTAHIGLDAFDAMDGDGNIVTFHGIDGVGTAYDEIVGQKLTRRFEVVDLGSKNYTKSGIWFSSDLADAKRPTSSTMKPLAICARFNANTWQQANDGDFLIAYTGSGAADNAILQIAASAYASVADFKAAMQGVSLVYELATPTEYTIVDPLGDTYHPTEGGTEEIIAADIVAPFCADIRYKAEDESGIASSILEALKAAGKIASYSVTYDPATSKQVITVS